MRLHYIWYRIKIRSQINTVPTPTVAWTRAWLLQGASRSQSALHMHVLVCICSNVRQFHEIIDMIQMCYHTNHCACWPCFVTTRVFLLLQGGGGVQETVHAAVDRPVWVTDRVTCLHPLRVRWGGESSGTYSCPLSPRFTLTKI